MRRTDMVIGVTGGVGTGKSTILQILREQYHAFVIIADDVSRALMMPGQETYEQIVKAFGEEILCEGPGSPIDRAYLASLVFADPDKLQMLNSLVHPATKQCVVEQIEKARQEGFFLIVIETAILIEAGYMELLDELWVVYTDLEVRMSRLKETRGYSEEKIRSIIANQMDPDRLKAQADFVIDNSGSLEQAEKQIQEHFAHASVKN